MTKNEIQIDNVVRFFSIPSIHLNVEILFHLQTEYETWNKLDVYCILNKFVTYKLTLLFAERTVLNRTQMIEMDQFVNN